MYRLLLGDVALQRGEPALAARAYLEAARETRDPVLARRATEIAVGARARSLSVESARLWSEIDPSAQRPKQLLAALASGAGGKGFDSPGIGNDIKSEIERVLADASASPAALSETFLQLNRLLAQDPDRQATFRLVESVAQPYPDLAEARFAVALAAYNTGLSDLSTSATALREVDRALILKPGWERAAMLKAEILGQALAQRGDRLSRQYLAAHPDSKAAAGSLAQLYVEQKRYAEARAIFERFWAADHANRDYEFAIAALAVQMKDWDTAEKLFEDLAPGELRRERRRRVLPRADRRGDGALRPRVRALPCRPGRRARLDREAARRGDAGEAEQARRSEALSRGPPGRHDRAAGAGAADRGAAPARRAATTPRRTRCSSQALTEHPDHPGLLYDIAMVAEKLDKIDVLEARLARLIELEPDNAQALNALGYTLVDRTPRTAEGTALIERAHKLSPGDPFILDSMGWAQFRMGHLDQAEDYLRRALAERPDPEIAAHLGEVLWARGERSRAREVWQSQLKSTPDNPVLLETMRRLAP